MISKRGRWFTVDLENTLSIAEKKRLMDDVAYWDYGTFIVIRTEALHSAAQVHEYLDGILGESPLSVCIADDIIRILDRLEVHYNSVQD